MFIKTPKPRHSITSLQSSHMAEFHTKLQRFACRVIAPVAILAFGLQAFVVERCWQDYVVFAGVLALSATWWLAYSWARKGHVVRGGTLIIASVIALATINGLLLRGSAATNTLAMATMVVYGSYFGWRIVLISASASLVGLVAGQAAWISGLWTFRVLSPASEALYTIVLAALIFPALVVVLMRSRSTSSELTSELKQLYLEQAEVIRTAQQAAGILDEVINTITDVSRAFSNQAAEQASALAEINASMAHVRKISAETALSADAARREAEQLKDKSRRGTERLRSVEAGFDRIVETNEVVKTEFDDLAHQAENIEDILRTNREIAGQIKILAVNAGIQAAKAGTYGAGFRVVAGELKGMILRTDVSLAQSRHLLEDIRTRARHSSTTIQRSSDLLKQQFDEVNSAVLLLEEIREGFSGTTGRVERINDAAKEQQSRLDEVGAGIDHIDFAAAELNASTAVLIANVQKITESHLQLQTILEVRATALRASLTPESPY